MGLAQLHHLRNSCYQSVCLYGYGRKLFHHPQQVSRYHTSLRLGLVASIACSHHLNRRRGARALEPLRKSFQIGQRRFLSDDGSLPDWIEEVIELAESGEVLGSYKGLRPVRPGLDDHILVGEKKKVFSDAQIIESMYNIIMRRRKWGPETATELELLIATPNVYHVNEVLKRFHDLNLAVGLFNWTRKQKWYKPNAYTFTILIDRLGQANNFDGVKWVIDIMQEEGCQGTPVTFSVLIKWYVRALKLNEAHDAYKQMKKLGHHPDLPTFNFLIKAFVGAGTYHKALEIFEEMEEIGIMPDGGTYELVVPSLATAGNLDKACRLFEEMKAKGYPPNVATYSCLINQLGRAGRLDTTLIFFRDMQNSGLVPTAPVYASVIESFAKAGKFEIAMKTWMDMQKAGFRPSAALHTFLIEVYLKARQLDKAMQLLGSMLKFGHLPSRGLYSDLIESHLKAKQLEVAKSLFFSMQEAGVLPTPAVCTALVDGYTGAGDGGTALKLFSSMQDLGFRHTERTCALLLSSLLKQDQQDQSKRILRLMKQYRYSVDGIASNILMGFLQEGHVEAAVKWFQVILSEGMQPNARSTRHFIETCLKDGLYDASKQALEKFVKSGFSTDLRLYTTILSAFSRCSTEQHEGTLMSMLVGSGHQAHKFLCGLLCGPGQRQEPAISFVRSFFENFKHEVDEKSARWFTCVLLNYLVVIGQMKRARCVWRVACEKQIFTNRISFEHEILWSLDVRALSIGAALTAVVHTLHRFRKRMVLYQSVPRRVKIVTGVSLREPIEDLLKPLGSPFEGHGGALRCRGHFVAEWFGQPFVERFLANETMPRDEIILQRLNLIFPRPKVEPYFSIMNPSSVSLQSRSTE